MKNARNQRTTHPRKAKRRASALENFTLAREHMASVGYTGRKYTEFLALGGFASKFADVPQR